mmetsp:Transcript_41659/g.99830  ORF Transcript_41659/g.99830 Transcript_41659/m.99830 type:complete len:486 (-) Transcript_41659:315-1772(-)
MAPKKPKKEEEEEPVEEEPPAETLKPEPRPLRISEHVCYLVALDNKLQQWWRDALTLYLQAFCQLQVKWLHPSVEELHLKTRPHPSGDPDRQQFSAPFVLRALEKLRPADGACVVGLTMDDLYHTDNGAVPGEPVPTPNLTPFGKSSPKTKVGVVTFANLGDIPMFTEHFGKVSQTQRSFEDTMFATKKGATKEDKLVTAHCTKRHSTSATCYRRFVRRGLKLITRVAARVLGVRQCMSHLCLNFHRDFVPDANPFTLCVNCEMMLCQQVQGPGKRPSPNLLRSLRDAEMRLQQAESKGMLTEELEQQVAELKAEHDGGDVVGWCLRRNEGLGNVLKRLGRQLEPIKIGHKWFREFDAEIQWLEEALNRLEEHRDERHLHVDRNGKRVLRQRGYLSTAKASYDHPCRMDTRHTTLPLVRTCLLDCGAMGVDVAHKMGDLDTCTRETMNAKHSTGGTFRALGGSLKPKMRQTHLAVTARSLGVLTG